MRAIEIPIIRHYLDTHPHEYTLEIGNVTKHYYDTFRDFKKKDTVDKYEEAYDVYNEDIYTFKPKHRYDFIYSISTFEHMDSDGGNNPDYKKPEQLLDGKFSTYAFCNMNRVCNDLLSRGGVFIATFPIGQDNCEIDQSLFNEEFKHFKVSKIHFYFMKQINEITWKQDTISINKLKELQPKWNSNKHYLCIMEVIK
ncbi:MAG: hypothetical protein JW840_02365 [Candidatus Thermoplasmatota archaeon]|nr:hypothetical protein [Candidatus Thermoplasmatota archaeon]